MILRSHVPTSACGDSNIRLGQFGCADTNAELRLGKIARSRREEMLRRTIRAVNYLWLVCVDGKVADAVGKTAAEDQEYLAEVTALRAWLSKYGRIPI